MNGISSHIFDYDDTHLRTIIHPAGAVASALLALSEYHPISGRDFVNALVLGVEAECRIGNAVNSRCRRIISPNDNDSGHGVFTDPP